MEDFERCYRAVESRDPRFDGWFFTAVTSTGVYCRPSCPAITPKKSNVRFYPTAAAAQQAGFRACLRCRPDAAPGSPEWLGRADVAARAVRLVFDGVVDREGVSGLARRLGYGERQLHRVLVAEVGTGALALARAQRAQTARLLVESTELPMAQVAFGAGFASVRQFNDTVRAVFGRTPTALRARRRGGAGREDRSAPDGAAQTIAVRLAHRLPIDAPALLEFLARRTVAGIEEGDGEGYRRNLRLPHGNGRVELTPAPDHVRARFVLADVRDLTAAVARCRHLCNLDADPEAVDRALAGDEALAPLVHKRPGLRVPGTVDGFETAVRAVLGQQVSVQGARTLAARLVAQAGEPCAVGVPGLDRVFPGPEELARALSGPLDVGLPDQRRRALAGLSAAVAAGGLALDAGADPAETTAALVALPGIGPWTAAYVALRALGDPDAFLDGDLGTRRAAERLGLGDTRAELTARSAQWRPWRAYAQMHLWTHAGEGPAAPRRGAPSRGGRAA
ncbi:MAG: DNA-3-methyladenine glycosylase 2 family protein [Acidobacteriota bacterium]|nr:DNA-3-methyladenine glycosylase 2 family protein [Acidobacteriota bacterium]